MAPDIRSSVRDFAASLPSGAKVLDIGCGHRPYESYFAHCEYIGIDVTTSGRSAADKRAHVYFNGIDVPFDDAQVDAVLCTEVLEHAIEPAQLVSEIRRVLRPGGRALITVPFIWGEHETPFDFRRFSTFGIRRLLDDAKLEIVSAGKLTPGIDAIEALVRSEIGNFENNVLPPTKSWLRRAAATLSDRTWALQLFIWRRLYRFERIYIDNVVVVQRSRAA
jgi:SAM-dependent methyltransferase